MRLAFSRTETIAGSLSGWFRNTPLVAALAAASELSAFLFGVVPNLFISFTDARKRSRSRMNTFRLVVSSNTPDMKFSGEAFSSSLLVR